jgi:hypothetical protein
VLVTTWACVDEFNLDPIPPHICPPIAEADIARREGRFPGSIRIQETYWH